MPLYLSDQCIQEYSPPDELIEGLISKGTINFIYGEPSSGKSIFAVRLAACLAKGKPNYFGYECKESAFVYWPHEEPYGVIEKTAAVVQTEHLQLMDDTKFGITFGDGFGLQGASLEKAIYGIQQAFNELFDQSFIHKPYLSFEEHSRVLIIDTWAAVTAGMDENSAKDMGRAIKAIKKLQSSLNCSVFIVHHSGKDGSRGLRGHSGIHAAADNVWRISKQRNMHVVEVTKAKHHSGNKRFGFEVGTHNVTFENGKTEKSLPFCDPLSADSVKQVRTLSVVERLVISQLDELEQEGMLSLSRRQLADALEGSEGVSSDSANREKAVDRAVSSLLANKLISEGIGGVSLLKNDVFERNVDFSANKGTWDTPF